KPSLIVWIIRGGRKKDRDAAHALGLLRVCPERPRNCHTAEKADEFPPPHVRPNKLKVIVTIKSDVLEGTMMSALGQKRTFAPQYAMSAFPPKATSKATYRMSA